MPTTSNFGWTTPADTDLVKDGALAIRTLGNGIDTSLVDLKGGTTGQNLRKASNTDLDFTFAGDATNTVVDAAGDLLYGTAADTLGRLAIGSAGQVLKVNSGATAPEWGAAGSSDVVLLNTTSFTTVASQQVNSVFSSTYDAYRIYVRFTAISATNTEINLALRIGSDVNATSGNTITASSTTVTGFGVAGRIGLSSTTYPGLTGIICDLNSPNLAARTTGIASGFYVTNVGAETQFSSAFVWNNTTQYTGLTISPASGTMSGEIKIYGFKA